MDTHRDKNDKSSVGEYLDDAAITGVVKSKILAQSGLDSLDISVETNKGIVTLTGNVNSQDQIDLAERVTKEAKGVTNIENRLMVKPQ